MALLSFEETCGTLRELVRQGKITAWNHRHDTLNDDADVWIVDLLPGNVPRCVEWSQAQVERWLRQRAAADAILETL